MTSSAPADVDALGRSYRQALLDDCIPFWFPRSVDELHGGFLHCVDRDGTLLDSDKSVWAQGRMSWMLLTLYNTVERRPEWLAWAERGLQFIEEHCIDADGRLFFHVTREGRPVRKRRYAFAESFAAMAFAAHARATGHDRSAGRARELFALFTRWHFTPGLMAPKFTAARASIDLGSRLIALGSAQELRTNLGSEAGLSRWIERTIDEIDRLFVKPELECVMETVGPGGEIRDHFDGRLLNPGHAIEGAWFVLREGKARSDDRLVQLGCRMLDWTWARGWDQEHGGLFCLRDVFGKPVQEYWHDMKFWWPHDEALVATLLAWQLTGDDKYLAWHRQVFEWAFARFGDPGHGEWFGYLHRDGRLSTTIKGNLWKSFFHHPRSLWSCSTICEEMQTGPAAGAAGART